MRSRCRLALVLVVAQSAFARAEPRADPAPPPPAELSFDWTIDGLVATAAGAYWGAAVLVESHVAPTTCRWCAADELDEAARTHLRWSDPSAASLASNVAAYGLVPLVVVGGVMLAAKHEGRPAEIAGDVLVVAETVALVGDLTETVKPLVGRERPFVHALPAGQKSLTAHPSDNNLSFYSGHTSFAFALAVSTGTVASIRGYRWTPLVWTAGLASAALVGYLRIAADKHYLTDVLAGAAVGSAAGYTVPTFFHSRRRREAPSLGVAPLPDGGTELVLALRW